MTLPELTRTGPLHERGRAPGRGDRHLRTNHVMASEASTGFVRFDFAAGPLDIDPPTTYRFPTDRFQTEAR